jgi:hypothetical protein
METFHFLFGEEILGAGVLRLQTDAFKPSPCSPFCGNGDRGGVGGDTKGSMASEVYRPNSLLQGLMFSTF